MRGVTRSRQNDLSKGVSKTSRFRLVPVVTVTMTISVDGRCDASSTAYQRSVDPMTHAMLSKGELIEAASTINTGNIKDRMKETVLTCPFERSLLVGAFGFGRQRIGVTMDQFPLARLAAEHFPSLAHAIVVPIIINVTEDAPEFRSCSARMMREPSIELQATQMVQNELVFEDSAPTDDAWRGHIPRHALEPAAPFNPYPL